MPSTTNTTRAKAVAAAALAPLMLAACSGGDAATGEDRETLTIITSNDAPFSFTNDDGDLIGIDGDMITLIAEQEGWDIEVFTTDFNTLIPALQAGRGDVIVDAMYITDEREEQVNFTDPWYTQGEGMLVPAGSDLTAREDVAGQVVGAQTGTVFQDWIATLEPAETVFFDSQAALIQAVANGQVDAAFTDLAVLAYSLVQNPNDDVEIVDPYEPFFPGTIGAAVADDDEELLEQLNTALADLQETPEYVEILERYGLTASNAVQ